MVAGFSVILRRGCVATEKHTYRVCRRGKGGGGFEAVKASVG